MSSNNSQAVALLDEHIAVLSKELEVISTLSYTEYETYRPTRHPLVTVLRVLSGPRRSDYEKLVAQKTLEFLQEKQRCLLELDMARFRSSGHIAEAAKTTTTTTMMTPAATPANSASPPAYLF